MVGFSEGALTKCDHITTVFVAVFERVVLRKDDLQRVRTATPK
jgi:hypothetical protein